MELSEDCVPWFLN